MEMSVPEKPTFMSDYFVVSWLRNLAHRQAVGRLDTVLTHLSAMGPGRFSERGQ